MIIAPAVAQYQSIDWWKFVPIRGEYKFFMKYLAFRFSKVINIKYILKKDASAKPVLSLAKGSA